MVIAVLVYEAGWAVGLDAVENRKISALVENHTLILLL
jgi:hypothetical protein